MKAQNPSEYFNGENAALFWAQEIMLTGDVGPTARNVTYSFLMALQVVPGLYNRMPPPNVGRLEAHDNYVGIQYLSQVFGFRLARPINHYGRMNRYCYNNIKPFNYVVEAQRHPIDIFFYKVLDKEMLAPWELAYLVGHIVLSAFGKGAGGKRLTHMRMKTLDHFGWKNPFYILARWFWKLKTGPIYKYLREYHTYDKDGNLDRLAQLAREHEYDY